MKFQLSPEKRIRLLLHGGVVRAELLAISSWIVVQFVIRPQISVETGVLPLLVMLATFAVQTFSRSDMLWRFSGVGFLLVFSASFKLMFVEFPDLYKVFSLPYTVMAVVGASLFTRSTLDYVFTALATWLIVWPHVELDVEAGSDIYMLVFAVYSIGLGWVNNYSYMRSLRSTLLVEGRYRVMAETDFLTAIFNRRALIERFQHFADSRDGGYFLMVDIDNFKRVNDELGHDAGDKVLFAMARCLESVKGSYCVGRLGGEEFGAVIDTLSLAEAVAYTEALISAVRECNSAPCAFTISAGLSDFKRGADISEVLRHADLNLYKAKHAGKNTYRHEERVKLVRAIRDEVGQLE